MTRRPGSTPAASGRRAGAAATSSPRPRSDRCSAPCSPASRRPAGGASSASPTRSSSSRPAPGRARWPAPSSSPSPPARAALRWVLVDRSPAMRARHAEHLPLAPAAMAFAPEDDDSPRDAADRPRARSRCPSPTCPGCPDPCVVLANELLDNLPSISGSGAAVPGRRCSVGLDDAGGLVEAVVPTEPPAVARRPRRRRRARVSPCRTRRARWLRDASPSLGPTKAAASSSSTTARPPPPSPPGPPGEWLRTYRGHERGGPAARGARHPGHHRRGLRRPAGDGPPTDGDARPRPTGCGPTASTTSCRRPPPSVGRRRRRARRRRRPHAQPRRRGPGAARPRRPRRLHRPRVVRRPGDPATGRASVSRSRTW